MDGVGGSQSAGVLQPFQWRVVARGIHKPAASHGGKMDQVCLWRQQFHAQRPILGAAATGEVISSHGKERELSQRLRQVLVQTAMNI